MVYTDFYHDSSLGNKPHREVGSNHDKSLHIPWCVRCYSCIISTTRNKLCCQHQISKSLLFQYLFGVLRRFQHCTGHITTGSWKAEETSTYSWTWFCTVNFWPTASNYQLSHLRSGREPNPNLRGRRGECYHSATMAPVLPVCLKFKNLLDLQTHALLSDEIITMSEYCLWPIVY